MRRLTFLGALAGLALGAAALAWWLAPRVVGWEPAGAQLAASESLVLQLNTPLTADSIGTHLSIEPVVQGQWRIDGRSLIFDPDRPWASGQGYSATLAAGALGNNGLPVLRSGRYAFRIRDPRLLFLRENDGAANLWSWAPGAGEVQLTTEPRGIWDYALDPDGGGLLFAAQDVDGSDDLIWVGLDGSRRVVLACHDSQCRAARRQPYGDLVAFERRQLGSLAEETETWVLDTADGRLVPAMDEASQILLGGASRHSRFPRWSADGRWLAFYQPEQRVIVVRDFGGQGRPGLVPANLEIMGEWSPVALRLAYTELAFGLTEPHEHVDEQGQVTSHTETSLYEHLVISDLVTNETMDLSQGQELSDGLPSWSPDGRQLALSRTLTGGGRQLWLVAAEDGRGQALTNEPLIQHSAVSWSPDGATLAFMRRAVTGDAGPGEIWLIDLPNGEPRLAVEDGFLPAWLP